ncbi:MAG: hypothetical protein JXJ19_03095 [Elusimicrobia bacterium]|nr:hypothetical protein [Elusimicrobiota bacterium]
MADNADKKTKNTERVILVMGVFIILSGTLLNEWVLMELFSPDGRISSMLHIFIIRMFNLIFLFSGTVLVLLRKRIKLQFFYYAAVSILALIIMLEIMTRIAEKRVQKDNINEDGESIYIYSPEYYFDYRPSQVFIRRAFSAADKMKSVVNHINSISIRGPEIGRKEPGKRRVLMLGDSFIQAEEVGYGGSAGQVLQGMLDNGYEVISHGMGGWSPLLELNWLNKKGLTLEPDTVVLFLCQNDFHGPHVSRADVNLTKKAVFDENSIPVKFNVPADRSMEGRGVPGIRLFRFIRRNVIPFFKERYFTEQLTQDEVDFLLSAEISGFEKKMNKMLPPHRRKNTVKDIIRMSRPVSLWEEGTKNNINLSLGYLDKIAVILKEKNIRLIVTLVPFGWNISKTENKVGRRCYMFADAIIPLGGLEERIKMYCAGKGIEYFDLNSVLKKAAEERSGDLYYSYDGHWTSLGNRIVGEALYRYISNTKMPSAQ